MKRRIRNILFIAFVILFAVIGSYLILIAQGLVIDFENFRIEKTGAIFLKFNPRDATLSIDGRETDYTQKGILGLGGVIIKNLRPDLYELKISKEGFRDWVKKLEVQSGLITSENGVRLWPNEFSNQTLVQNNVQGFWLTNKGPVYKDENGQILFENTPIKGGEVVLTDTDSDTLVTKEGSNYFLIDLEDPRLAVNLTRLFNSLKQRQLNLPGSVPITGLFFHSFSPNKVLITSETSLYAIDTKKVEIEKLVTLKGIELVKLATSEVFVIDTEGKLTIINLLLKTSLNEPIEIGKVADFEADPDGGGLYILTTEGEIKKSERSSGKTGILATDVRFFEISPDGKRALAAKTGGELEIVHLKKFEGDLKYEAGVSYDISTASGKAQKIQWLIDFPNYAALLSEGTLVFQEIDSRKPVNSYPLFEKVLDYEIKKENLYLLKSNGELIVFSIAEDA